MMQTEEKNLAELRLVARTIRGLSIDAIEEAGCGHPGLPLGCAELLSYLFARFLNFNVDDPNWMNRDRFVLSAGHGSMGLYSALHLAGYPLSIEKLKKFRQLGHEEVAGHPEYGALPGIETTTGPLGQGVSTATGIALGQKIMESEFNVVDEGLLDSKTVVLAGDGDLMEGISAEAASLAGHLKLDNLIVIYDSNNICLDGDTQECFTEDTQKRYEAYGWEVLAIDGHNFKQIEFALEKARKTVNKPVLIIARTIIGRGSPSLAGTSEVHGKALGPDEAKLTKQNLGIPEEPFHVPSEIKDIFGVRHEQLKKKYDAWVSIFQEWAQEHPEKEQAWNDALNKNYKANLEETIDKIELKPKQATRSASGSLLQILHDEVPFLVGGSADLSCSDNTYMKTGSMVRPGYYRARNIKYGVREFAMGAIASGLALQGMIKPFCGTFFTFSDYMKNAIRLAALMNLPVIYQFTHDSFLLGEDGPTHQPVEHLAALRSMPNMTVIRPADNKEVKGAWKCALKANNPVAIILSRQNLPELDATSSNNVEKGAYIIKEASKESVDFLLLATGSEVELALNVAATLEEKGHATRVVSFPSFEYFEQQDKEYQSSVLCAAKKTVSIEAQSSFGWHKYIGRDGIAIAIDEFGKSGRADELAECFGFTPDQIVKKLLDTQ